jgi:hypothetical protein
MCTVRVRGLGCSVAGECVYDDGRITQERWNIGYRSDKHYNSEQSESVVEHDEERADYRDRDLIEAERSLLDGGLDVELLVTPGFARVHDSLSRQIDSFCCVARSE